MLRCRMQQVEIIIWALVPGKYAHLLGYQFATSLTIILNTR
jgi:hypothetical protein